jgi:hypothetical protein
VWSDDAALAACGARKDDAFLGSASCGKQTLVVMARVRTLVQTKASKAAAIEAIGA